MNFKELAELVKEKIDCFEYAQDQGIDLKPSGNTFRAASPFDTGDGKTCFTIWKDNKDFFMDWKTEDHGDVIELAALLNHNSDRSAALNELIKKTGVNTAQFNTSDYNNYYNKLSEKIDYWHQALLNNRECLDYLKDRQINIKTIRDLKMGYSEKRHRIMIPYFKNNKPVYFAGRIFPSTNYTPTKDEPKYTKAKIDGYNQHICWGIDTLGNETPLIIAEGAFDALSFYQEGFAVLSPLGGHFNKEQLKTVRAAASSPKHKETIIIFDTDAAGQGFTKRLAADLFNSQIKFKTAFVPNFKDVSEYYEANGELNGILETATDGLIYLCNSFKDDKDGFSDFILKAARHLSQPDIAELFHTMKDQKLFAKAWLNELERQCKKAPAETIIVNEILKKFQLLFTESGGFYEFDGLIWQKKDDTAIKTMIADLMGKFATGSKINSVFNLLAANCYRSIEFNKKRLMTFKNGTLELDSKVFRKPRYNDYINILLPYDYDPAATAPQWQQFLIDVTAGDQEKIDLLQEIAGYCLFPENSLQKCINLIGDGGNGKSVFAGALRDVFDDKNISTVQVSDFDNQFSRIHLKDSLINLCTEERPNIKNADGVFKNLTAGDPIDGCYKRKDIISFVPHAKLIVASNNYIVFNDATDAIMRRMLFVKFTERFLTDRDPIYEHEHKADVFLPDKLKKELSGIFNWILDGYDRLMKNKKFTVTAESEKIKESYQETINPIYIFIKNINIEHRDYFITADFYNEYRDWAFSNGYQTMNSNTFARRFNKAFENTHPNWHRERFRNGRGWQKAQPPQETQTMIDADFTEIKD